MIRRAHPMPWLLAALLCGANPADAARPPKAAAVEDTPPGPPSEVPPLGVHRPDGLRLVVEEAPGPAVSLALVVRMEDASRDHPAPSAARVVAHAMLGGGEAGQALRASGARAEVVVADNSIILELHTVRERWQEDLKTMLGAVSRPPLQEATLAAARLRATPFGEPWNLDELYNRMSERLVGRHDAVMLVDGAPAVTTVDTAVWDLEDVWRSDRMTLVAVGPLRESEVEAVVEEQFLVPPSATLSELPRPTEDPQALADEVTGTPPGYMAFGHWAATIQPGHAMVLAELLRQVVERQQPVAADCDGRYMQSGTAPAVLVVCGGVHGRALDVREVITRAMDLTTLSPPTPAQWGQARRSALARLRADRASNQRLCRRLAVWAAAGLHGGAPLERSVETAPAAELDKALSQLMTPRHAIRLSRAARSE